MGGTKRHRSSTGYAAGEELPDTDVAQLLAIRSRGTREVGMTLLHAFDVVAVTVGRYTEPFDSGPLLDTHWLGVRGVGETVRWGFDPGSGPFLDGGVPQPPDTVVDETVLERHELDDVTTIGRYVGPNGDLGTSDALATVGGPLGRHRSLVPHASDRLTVAGVLYGLHSVPTPARKATTSFEGRGETFRWDLDGVPAHVIRYRELWAEPAGGSVNVKVVHGVARPSLLGSPSIEHGLVLSSPLRTGR